MFITGPDVVKTVTGEERDLRRARRRHEPRHQVGLCHVRLSRREGCLDDVRYLLSFLPANNLKKPRR